MNKTSTSHELAKHAIIIFILLFAFLPLYVMLVISFKDNTQFISNPLTPSAPFHFENWIKGWQLVGHYIANSIFVSTISVITILTTALLSAYVFARYTFPFKTLLWYLMLALLFMPGVMNIVPLFLILKKFSMLNSIMAISMLYAVAGQVFCIFVLRNFIEDIPNDLFEAAMVDGASPLRQIRDIVIPMSGSILATLAILRFLAAWNNFIQPMIFISDEYKQLLPVGLMRLDGEYVKQWGEMMAGYSIAAIPLIIIFIFTMRLFVKGLTSGAVKG